MSAHREEVLGRDDCDRRDGDNSCSLVDDEPFPRRDGDNSDNSGSAAGDEPFPRPIGILSALCARPNIFLTKPNVVKN